jgi:hypothetical protein
VTSVGGQAKSALTPGSISSSKPSVIVVQRSSGIGGGGVMGVPAKALLTKVLFFKFRINPKIVLKRAKNGQKWPKMAKNGQKWPKMAKNGQKWLKYCGSTQ